MPDLTRLPERLHSVRHRIEAACSRAGRDPSEITLIAVTKTFALDVLRAVLDAGIPDLGENRALEFADKADALGDRARWHFIGSLQRNKAREVAERADLFHALDSVRLAKELNKRARTAERVLSCLVQVNISGEESKHGVEPSGLGALLEEVRRFEHLRITGVMGMAAPAAPEDLDRLVRPQFARLRRLADDLGREHLPHLSMGMSGDFEVAIEEGATHIRVGSALVGPRD
ncbi:MAG: YggS family pyridoxal phosphate-dependent enzyme [Bacteroidota bacterium]